MWCVCVTLLDRGKALWLMCWCLWTGCVCVCCPAALLPLGHPALHAILKVAAELKEVRCTLLFCPGAKRNLFHSRLTLCTSHASLGSEHTRAEWLENTQTEVLTQIQKDRKRNQRINQVLVHLFVTFNWFLSLTDYPEIQTAHFQIYLWTLLFLKKKIVIYAYV